MGRGLSPLQRQVLVLALENRERHGRTFDMDEGADVYTYEILARFMGFQPEVAPLYVVTDSQKLARTPFVIHFRISSVGQERYLTAMTAVSRSLRRLARRRLVERVSWGEWPRCSGADLTPVGVAEATRIRNAEGRRTARLSR